MKFIYSISDVYYKLKLNEQDDTVESCEPTPCLHDGKCVPKANTTKHHCQCLGHFTGRWVFQDIFLLYSFLYVANLFWSGSNEFANLIFSEIGF